MVHADLSSELLCTIFAPRTALHDGAVIIRDDRILAAAALLPLTEMALSERFGTRHRAALGITEDTDAVAVVVSEESGQMSVVERARIVRVPSEAQLQRALSALLEAPAAPPGLGRRRSPGLRGRARGRSPHPHDAGPRGDAGPRRGLPAAAARPLATGSADTRPRTRRPQDGPAAVARGRRVGRLDQGRRRRRPRRRPSPTPVADQDGTGTTAVVARR